MIPSASLEFTRQEKDLKNTSKKQKRIVLSILLAAIIIATGVLVPMVVQGEEFNDINPIFFRK